MTDGWEDMYWDEENQIYSSIPPAKYGTMDKICGRCGQWMVPINGKYKCDCEEDLEVKND